MTRLEIWLGHATRCLAPESAAKIRREISEHYESAKDSALRTGLVEDAADEHAVTVLGDPKIANHQYRHVLLTSTEARLLRNSDREAQMVCASTWRRWILVATPVAVLAVAITLRFKGAVALGRDIFVGGLAMSFVFLVPFLPVYTPLRSRVFRALKWVVLSAALVLILGPLAAKMTWLLPACLWPVVWAEWTRISIRRKLPVAQWPKQLYL